MESGQSKATQHHLKNGAGTPHPDLRDPGTGAPHHLLNP